MVVISSVVSVVSSSALGLLAELGVLLIVTSLCLAFNVAWFRRAFFFSCSLVDCGFTSIPRTSLPHVAMGLADSAVLAVFAVCCVDFCCSSLHSIFAIDLTLVLTW